MLCLHSPAEELDALNELIALQSSQDKVHELEKLQRRAYRRRAVAGMSGWLALLSVIISLMIAL